ncbi:MAG: hypothetical protein HXS41_15440 [Theionarchaea archaeon]|nr:hypothetical protein [Theionarchaea archaeon]
MKVRPIDCIERHILGFLEGKISELDPLYIPPYTYFQGRNLDRENYVYLVASQTDNLAEPVAGCASAIKTYFREDARPLRKVLIDRLVMSPDAPPEEVFTAIMTYMTEFSANFILEANIFSEIQSPLFFPTTLSKEGSYIPPQYTPLFEEEGFTPVKTQYCYTLHPAPTPIPNPHPHPHQPSLHMRPMNITDEKDRSIYASIWNKSTYNMFQTFDISTFFLHSWTIPTNLLMIQDSILFAEENGKVKGIIEWKPNLHTLIQKDPQKYFAPEESARSTLNLIDEAKICKCVTVNDREDILEQMITQTLTLLTTTYHMKTCQIGNIDRDDTLLRGIIEKMGERCATITYMRRGS